ncbi:tape measure protein [Flavobacterium kingsejongi]|uniref:Tape measure protein N-terminal domain-containing protein n=1 Tax=Flavobacterium kingsejongi TaxID=1678728 RepID=A0A2S1LM22_9FLAO|nr:tape measure protein [Flavobacterium kingsejongi]AWG24823.1 hypothetical protein FK004_06060 [Flavobacterium kingsejongi]
MSNIVEFVVKMRDMMSGQIGRLNSTTGRAFTNMSRQAQNVTRRNQVLGQSFSQLQRNIQQVNNTISTSTIPSQIASARRELAALERQASRHSGNTSRGGGGSSGGGGGMSTGSMAIGSWIGGLALQIGNAIAGVISSSLGTIISKTMKKEQDIVGLSTFLGKDGADKAYKNIRKDADVTPFDTDSLVMVNRSLISAGLSAEAARQDTLHLVNAISAVGGGNDVLSRMAANMQQIKTVGKATAMDIRQFGIAGINIYAMLAKSTGKSIDQVKEMEVSYDDLSKTLAMAADKGGIYAGAMEAMSRTKFGRWSTIQDKISNTASDIGDAFSVVFDRILDMGVQFSESIPAMLARAQPYIDMISTGVGRVIDYVTDIVNGTSGWNDYIIVIVQAFKDVYRYSVIIGEKIYRFVSSFLDFVQKSEILKDVFRLIGWIIEKVVQVISSLMDTILWLWDNIVKPILEAIDKAYKWIKGVDDVEVKATKKLVAPKAEKKEDTPFVPMAATAAGNDASGKAVADSVVGGGPKVVNIHVGKFFDNLQFTTLNSTETAQEIENLIMECMARVVYNGSKMI